MRNTITRIPSGELQPKPYGDEEALRKQRLNALLDVADIVRKRSVTDNQYRHRINELLALVKRVDLQSK